MPRQVFVKAPNIAFGENPSSAGRANGSGQTGGHDGHRRVFDINATAPKNCFGISASPLLVLVAWARELRFFLRFYAFATVLNIGHFRRPQSMCSDEASRRTRDRHFTPSSRFDLVRRSVHCR